jgi:hypothetical protein
MRHLPILIMIVLLSFSKLAIAGPPDENGNPTHNSVYDYAINWAVQTGTTEVTVQVQARYCSACNPNTANNPGCPEFTHGYPPPYYPYNYWGSYSEIDGRYTAVRIKNSSGTVLATQKMINNPTNWPIDVIHQENFVFSGLSVSAGDTITVEADTYCSWCGHWYPSPVNVQIIGSDSKVTYTGDLSALAGTIANISAKLIDKNTGDPLAGRTIKFTLNPSSPIGIVSAITNSSGVANTTMLIPIGTPVGTYVMDTRFGGDASYFPCSDQDDFEVFVKIPIILDIKPSSWPNPLNVGSNGVLPVAIAGTKDFDVLHVNPKTLKLNGVDFLRFNYEDVCNYSNPSKGPDGLLDLTMKFDTQTIIASIGPVIDGQLVILTLTGNLYSEYGGTPIEGIDVVVIIKKGK